MRKRFPRSLDDFYGLALVLAIVLFGIYALVPSIRYKANELFYQAAKRFYVKSVDGNNYMPRGYDIAGIDISHHQGLIFWDELQNAQIGGETVSFVFMKATEGKTFRDKQFRRNWKKAKESGIARGAYHYYKPNVKSSHQANHFIKNVRIEKGDLPPVLDIEEQGKYGLDNTRKGLLNWLQIVEKHYKIKPIIYCNPNHYQIFFQGQSEFKDYPIWIAHYYSYKPRFKSKAYKFWQYTDKGKVGGINNRVDLDVFNGSIDQFKEMLVP